MSESVTIPSDSENYDGNNELSSSASPATSSSSNSPVILYTPPTLWGLVRGAAINLVLPFINGLMLGFGELFAHEIAFRLGWSGTKVCWSAQQLAVPLHKFDLTLAADLPGPASTISPRRTRRRGSQRPRPQAATDRRGARHVHGHGVMRADRDTVVNGVFHIPQAPPRGPTESTTTTTTRLALSSRTGATKERGDRRTVGTGWDDILYCTYGRRARRHRFARPRPHQLLAHEGTALRRVG